jgi:hypothetical protein
MFCSFSIENPAQAGSFSGLPPLEKRRTDFLSGRETPLFGAFYSVLFGAFISRCATRGQGFLSTSNGQHPNEKPLSAQTLQTRL